MGCDPTEFGEGDDAGAFVRSYGCTVQKIAYRACLLEPIYAIRVL